MILCCYFPYIMIDYYQINNTNIFDYLIHPPVPFLMIIWYIYIYIICIYLLFVPFSWALHILFLCSSSPLLFISPLHPVFLLFFSFSSAPCPDTNKAVSKRVKTMSFTLHCSAVFSSCFHLQNLARANAWECRRRCFLVKHVFAPDRFHT